MGDRLSASACSTQLAELFSALIQAIRVEELAYKCTYPKPFHAEDIDFLPAFLCLLLVGLFSKLAHLAILLYVGSLSSAPHSDTVTRHLLNLRPTNLSGNLVGGRLIAPHHCLRSPPLLPLTFLWEIALHELSAVILQIPDSSLIPLSR